MIFILLCIQNTIKLVFPYEDVSRNQEKRILKPWMNKNLLKAISERDNAKLKWTQSGRILNSIEHQNYKKLRNSTTKLTRLARKNFLSEKCSEAKGDSEKLWKVIKSALNSTSKPDIAPDFLVTHSMDGNVVKLENKLDIANEMNRELAEMGAKLAEKLQPTDAHFTDYLDSVQILL